jgi:hypothetical protein
VGAGFAFVLWFCTRPAAHPFTRWLTTAPLWAWLALHSFRLPLELLLYSLVMHGVIAAHMSFAGYNFDVLVGLTAPVAAAWAWRYKNAAPPKAARLAWVVWTMASMGLLANILVLAVLSIPFPFQVFTSEPANRMVGGFPFILLATWFVPLALAGHLAAWRRLFIVD